MSGEPKRPLQRLAEFLKKYLAAIIVALAVAWLAASLRVPKPKTAFDTNAFGNLPVLADARIKPIDSLARNALLMLRENGRIDDETGRPMTPEMWFLDMMFREDKASHYKAFVINNPDVLGLLDKTQSPDKYYSFTDLDPFLQEIQNQTDKLKDMRDSDLTPFQRHVKKLSGQVSLYDSLEDWWFTVDGSDLATDLEEFHNVLLNSAAVLRDPQAAKDPGNPALAALNQFMLRYKEMAERGYFRPVPKGNSLDWQTIGESIGDLRTGEYDPAVRAYGEMGAAYVARNAEAFNKAVASYQQYLDKNFPQFLAKTHFEFRFNLYDPFFKCIILYLCVFLLALASWLVWPETLGRAAFWLLVVTFVLHTAGLLARMWIQGRPPVTNLYSSAIFIGWAVCVICIILERTFRNGIGTIAAATMGFLTLIIAEHLMFDGDTMEMLQAVLDSNFWLSTHVVAVTLGYAATFLAGLLAIIYVARGMFTPSLDKGTAKSLNKMVYGIVCFATLFSFTGTVLGGIWADQSWGRFWGFDPKENGALIIVLWNAIILHARWGGFIRERGLMNMAMFGNIVTSFSWFGVNMLGAGLHSYGFTERAFWWLLAFDFNQLLLIAIGLLPLRYWRSFQDTPAPARKDAEPAALPH